MDVSGAGLGPGVSRCWLVTVAESESEEGGDANFRAADFRAGAVANSTLLFELTDWNNSGAVFVDNVLHDSIDGLRWKSSGSLLSGNRWKGAWRSFPAPLTGLEVTPLRSFLEGPLAIQDVAISNNTFFGVNESFVSRCEGMAHRASPRYVSCSNVTVSGNRYPSKEAEEL
jgi:hypothetical protein